MSHPTRARGSRADIVIVDDVPENLHLLESMLRQRGYRVRSFPRGRLALAAAAKTPPDLILLDVGMPDMNGYETCKRLKADPRLAGIPVIFISALAETERKLDGFRSGGVDYVGKPFQVEEVLARVDAHLELRRLQVLQKAQNRKLRESYARLRKLETLRDDLSHMIVHDLRAPLMVIGGYLTLASRRAARYRDRTLEGFLLNAEKGSRRVNEMVSAILDVTRLEARQVPLKVEPSDLEALARQALEQLGPLAVEHEVLIDTPVAKIVAACDRSLIGRVILNLLDNALKFTPNGGRVHLLVRCEGEHARVEVRDSGPGIPKDQQRDLFKKYARGAGARGRPSTGLGLAFCKLAVDAHGGRIGAMSVPGKGATIWFELPRREAAVD